MAGLEKEERRLNEGEEEKEGGREEYSLRIGEKRPREEGRKVVQAKERIRKRKEWRG